MFLYAGITPGWARNDTCPAKGKAALNIGLFLLEIHLNGDQAGSARVILRPMVRETREVFLGDDVVVVRRGCIETVEDDSDKQVHEHVRDRQRKTGRRVGARQGKGGAYSCFSCLFHWTIDRASLSRWSEAGQGGGYGFQVAICSGRGSELSDCGALVVLNVLGVSRASLAANTVRGK